MAQERSIFRPGAGAVIQSFTAAVTDAVMYPADWVILNRNEVPTDQGSSGVIEGGTLGANDFVECSLSLISGELGCGSMVLGVLMGKGINAVSDWTDVSAHAFADGDVAIIQNGGVHPQTAQATGATAGDYLVLSAVGGEMVNATTATLTSDLNTVGVALTGGGTYTRVSGTSNDGTPTFISRLR